MGPMSKILFVASPGVDDAAALRQAVEFADNNQAQLTVVGVIKDVEKSVGTRRYKPKTLLHDMMQQQQVELAELVSSIAAPESAIEVKVLVGKPFLQIIREVLRNHYDLVVKSAESIASISLIFGSTDLNLLRNCPCPLWIIKSTEQKGYREIVAAVDYDFEDPNVDQLNGRILGLAAAVALADFSEMHVVHAWRLLHEDFLRSAHVGIDNNEVDAMAELEQNRRRQWLEKLVADHCASQGEGATDYLQPKIHLPKGDASSAVPALANEIGAELIVMGTVGRTGIPGFFIGNTAETILNQIDCSVLTVKPHGFVSPVTES
mgnify:FL=1